MAVRIRPMTMQDYPETYALWKNSQGIGLSDADTPEAIERYLSQNPGGSFVAIDENALVGAVLCGSDGRRGYLHHLAVASTHRGKGVGGKLVAHCLEALRRNGITRCHIFVYQDNPGGKAFWKKAGWFERGDLLIMSKDV